LEEEKVHEGQSSQKKKKKKRDLSNVTRYIHVTIYCNIYVRHGKTETDIWFVFGFLEFEMKFGQ